MIKKNEAMEKINAIRRRYGEAEFRMAIQHLIDTGQLNFTAENVTAAKIEIQNETPENALLTAGFQMKLLDCCLELAGQHTWDIMLYIKLYLSMEGDDLALLEAADEALSLWKDYMAPKEWKDAVADPDYRVDILKEMIRRHNVEYTAAEVKESIRFIVEELKKEGACQ